MRAPCEFRACVSLCAATTLLFVACGGQAAHTDSTSDPPQPGNASVDTAAQRGSGGHWLAYVSDEVIPRQPLLYAVDLDDPRLPRTLLSVGLAAGEQVDSFTFAPDGQHLAFVVNRGESTGYRRELFVSALSAARAEPGVWVPTPGGVYWPREGAWALDSKRLLFGVETSPEDFELFSVGAEAWSAPVRVAAGWQANWISSGLAAVSSTAGVGYLRREGLGFSLAHSWGFNGDLRVASPALERAGFIREIGPCLSQAYFVDARADRVDAFESLTSYSFSPTVEWLAVGRTAPTRVDIHALGSDEAQSPTFQLLDTASACSVNWAGDGTWLTYVGNDHAPHIVRLGQGALQAYDITGISEELTRPPSISADDHFLAAAADRLFVSAVNGGLPAAAAPVSEPMASLETFEFAPNSRALLYIGRREPSDSNGVHWVDLSAPQPAPSQALSEPARGNVQDAAWSPDSAAIAYRVTEGPLFPQRSPTNLYVSRIQDGSHENHRVNAALHCDEPTGYCQGVSAFAFQP